MEDTNHPVSTIIQQVMRNFLSDIERRGGLSPPWAVRASGSDPNAEASG